MEYISAKRVSEKWGISQTRVTILANSGRIPGSKLIGKTWMIPENAEKPSDGRSKRGRNTLDVQTQYRFPLLLFGRYTAEKMKELYTAEEQKLYAAQSLFEKGFFEAADVLLDELIKTTMNRYIKIGALYYRYYNAIYMKEFEKADATLVSFRMIMAEDFPYKEEIYFIFYELEYSVKGGDYLIDSFRVDSAYSYTEEIKPYLAAFSAYYDMLRFSTKGDKINPVIYGLYCDYLKEAGYIHSAMLMHCYISMMYALTDNREAQYAHLRRAVKIAVAREEYVGICEFSLFFRAAFSEVLKDYPPKIQEKMAALGNEIESDLAAYHAYKSNTKIFLQLRDDDYKYIIYAVRGLTIKEIAEREMLSEKTIAKRLSVLYKKLNVTGKEDLAKLWTQTIRNAQSANTKQTVSDIENNDTENTNTENRF